MPFYCQSLQCYSVSFLSLSFDLIIPKSNLAVLPRENRHFAVSRLINADSFNLIRHSRSVGSLARDIIAVNLLARRGKSEDFLGKCKFDFECLFDKFYFVFLLIRFYLSIMMFPYDFVNAVSKNPSVSKEESVAGCFSASSFAHAINTA